MPSITLTDELVESCKLLLETRGVNTTGLKTKDIVIRVFKYALGDTESLFHSPLPARIERWKQKSQVYKSGGALAPEPLLPAALTDALQQKVQELHVQEQTLTIPADISAPSVEPDSLTSPKKTSPPTAPWTGLKRVPLEEAHKYIHIKHPIVKWSSGDDLKQLAAEVALAHVPRSMYNSPLLVDTAESLYKKFYEYKKDFS